MIDVPNTIVDKFISTTDARGDDPEETLSRLMFEYVREDSTISELLAEDDLPVQSLNKYDPVDDRILGKEAIKMLPSHAGSIQIDPDDVCDDEMPQDRDLKRSVILGVLRYRLLGDDTNRDRRYETVVRRDDVAAAAQSVVGVLDTDYKRDEYVEQILTEVLIPNPADDSTAFFSPLDIQEYLKSLNPPDSQTEDDVSSLSMRVQIEDDVWYLSEYLVENHSDQIDVDEVNKVRERFWFNQLNA